MSKGEQINLNFEDMDNKPRVVTGEELDKVIKDYRIGPGMFHDGTKEIREIIFKDGEYYFHNLVKEEADKSVAEWDKEEKDLGIGHDDYEKGNYK